MIKKSAPTVNEAKDPEARKKLAKKELHKELMEALPNSALAEKKRKQKKKQKKQIILVSILLIFGYMFYWLVKPYQSGMPYGICKVFIELYVPYPHTVHFSEVEQFSDSVRVWFSKIDGFGEYTLEPMQCYFKPPDNGNAFQLDRITIGRREIDPYLVEQFNKSIPVIVAFPPDLTYPTAIPDSLEGMQFNFDQFRKPILD